MRSRVSVAAAGGMSHAEIADAIGCARGTLEKHFAGELAQGAAKRRMAALLAMYEAAIGGNVAAQKAYLAAGRAAALPQSPRIGKKEQAQLDAVSAADGTEWEDLLNPKRLQ